MAEVTSASMGVTKNSTPRGKHGFAWKNRPKVFGDARSVRLESVAQSFSEAGEKNKSMLKSLVKTVNDRHTQLLDYRGDHVDRLDGLGLVLDVEECVYTDVAPLPVTLGRETSLAPEEGSKTENKDRADKVGDKDVDVTTSSKEISKLEDMSSGAVWNDLELQWEKWTQSDVMLLARAENVMRTLKVSTALMSQRIDSLRKEGEALDKKIENINKWDIVEPNSKKEKALEGKAQVEKERQERAEKHRRLSEAKTSDRNAKGKQEEVVSEFVKSLQSICSLMTNPATPSNVIRLLPATVGAVDLLCKCLNHTFFLASGIELTGENTSLLPFDEYSTALVVQNLVFFMCVWESLTAAIDEALIGKTQVDVDMRKTLRPHEDNVFLFGKELRIPVHFDIDADLMERKKKRMASIQSEWESTIFNKKQASGSTPFVRTQVENVVKRQHQIAAKITKLCEDMELLKEKEDWIDLFKDGFQAKRGKFKMLKLKVKSLNSKYIGAEVPNVVRVVKKKPFKQVLPKIDATTLRLAELCVLGFLEEETFLNQCRGKTLKGLLIRADNSHRYALEPEVIAVSKALVDISAARVCYSSAEGAATYSFQRKRTEEEIERAQRRHQKRLTKEFGKDAVAELEKVNGDPESLDDPSKVLKDKEHKWTALKGMKELEESPVLTFCFYGGENIMMKGQDEDDVYGTTKLLPNSPVIHKGIMRACVNAQEPIFADINRYLARKLESVFSDDNMHLAMASSMANELKEVHKDSETWEKIRKLNESELIFALKLQGIGKESIESILDVDNGSDNLGAAIEFWSPSVDRVQIRWRHSGREAGTYKIFWGSTLEECRNGTGSTTIVTVGEPKSDQGDSAKKDDSKINDFAENVALLQNIDGSPMFIHTHTGDKGKKDKIENMPSHLYYGIRKMTSDDKENAYPSLIRCIKLKDIALQGKNNSVPNKLKRSLDDFSDEDLEKVTLMHTWNELSKHKITKNSSDKQDTTSSDEQSSPLWGDYFDVLKSAVEDNEKKLNAAESSLEDIVNKELATGTKDRKLRFGAIAKNLLAARRLLAARIGGHETGVAGGLKADDKKSKNIVALRKDILRHLNQLIAGVDIDPESICNPNYQKQKEEEERKKELTEKNPSKDAKDASGGDLKKANSKKGVDSTDAIINGQTVKLSKADKDGMVKAVIKKHERVRKLESNYSSALSMTIDDNIPDEFVGCDGVYGPEVGDSVAVLDAKLELVTRVVGTTLPGNPDLNDELCHLVSTYDLKSVPKEKILIYIKKDKNGKSEDATSKKNDDFAEPKPTDAHVDSDGKMKKITEILKEIWNLRMARHRYDICLAKLDTPAREWHRRMVFAEEALGALKAREQELEVIQKKQAVARATLDQIKQSFRVTVEFIGHGPGGAFATVMSTIAALWYRNSVDVRCTTFGAPRVGSSAFTDLFHRNVKVSQRLVNSHHISVIRSHSLAPKHVLLHVRGLIYMDIFGRTYTKEWGSHQLAVDTATDKASYYWSVGLQKAREYKHTIIDYIADIERSLNRHEEKAKAYSEITTNVINPWRVVGLFQTKAHKKAKETYAEEWDRYYRGEYDAATEAPAVKKPSATERVLQKVKGMSKKNDTSKEEQKKRPTEVTPSTMVTLVLLYKK